MENGTPSLRPHHRQRCRDMCEVPVAPTVGVGLARVKAHTKGRLHTAALGLRGAADGRDPIVRSDSLHRNQEEPTHKGPSGIQRQSYPKWVQCRVHEGGSGFH